MKYLWVYSKFVKRCYVCHSEDHFKKDCPERNKKKKFSYSWKKKSTSDSYSDGYDNAEVLVVSVSRNRNDWIHDSGGSFHMTPNSVCFRREDGAEITLEDVIHVPDLKRNLISLGYYDEKNYTILMKGGILKVLQGSKVIIEGVKGSSNIYTLKAKAVVNMTSISVMEEESRSQLCHSRLGHMSEKGSKELVKQNLLENLKSVQLQFCEDCVYGKAHRVRFSKGRHSAVGVMDYVHSDLWRPSRVESLGGSRYFLSLVDDYSIRVWVYLLKHKSDAFEKFKDWKVMHEIQIERKLKKLRTDNGLEFCDQSLMSFAHLMAFLDTRQ